MMVAPVVAAPSPENQSFSRHRPHFYRCVAALWLLACVAAVVLRWRQIGAREFSDADDELRLLEVRDWLAGQSFRDVAQHRMNPPFGAPMHWSRLVDMPIAAAQLLLRPFLGVAGAETASAVIVPLVTLGIVMLMVALLARRLAGPGAGLLAAAMLPTTAATMTQLQPLRVDHHGWEIACAVAALWASLDRRGLRAGIGAGILIAIGLQISLELLPFAAMLGGLVAARFAILGGDEDRRRLMGYALALPVVEAALFFALHAPGDWTGHCDAVSPPHLAALAAVAAGCAALTCWPPRRAGLRWAGLAIVAGIALAIFHAIPPRCGADTFSALEPVVKTYWWSKIAEGQPAWRGGAVTLAAAIGFPLVALACAVFAVRRARAEQRIGWLAYAVVLAGATLVGAVVLRASSLSNAVAIPAAAWAALRLVGRAQRSGTMPVRVFGSVAAVIALAPLAPAVAVSLFVSDPPKAGGGAVSPPPGATAGLEALNVLPPARLFASLDFGPGLMLETHHMVLASGHHRNHVAMAQELEAWLGSDATAERILRARGIEYVVAHPAYSEVANYAKASPNGFAAHIARGKTPPWLRRVAIPGSPLFVWRVLPQPPAGLPSSRSAGGSVPTVAQISRNADLSPSS